MERGTLTPEQRHLLLQPIPKSRVSQDNKGHSHVEIHDVEAHLSRVFGFEGWDKEILTLDLIRERHGHDTKQDKGGWYVTYKATVRLCVYDYSGRLVAKREEGATGSAANQPEYGDAHDLALKNAISYATKRCAKTLGDQFGLSLYDNGSLGPLVMKLVDGLTWKELAELAAGEVSA